MPPKCGWRAGCKELSSRPTRGGRDGFSAMTPSQVSPRRPGQTTITRSLPPSTSLRTGIAHHRTGRSLPLRSVLKFRWRLGPPKIHCTPTARPTNGIPPPPDTCQWRRQSRTQRRRGRGKEIVSSRKRQRRYPGPSSVFGAEGPGSCRVRGLPGMTTGRVLIEQSPQNTAGVALGTIHTGETQTRIAWCRQTQAKTPMPQG